MGLALRFTAKSLRKVTKYEELGDHRMRTSNGAELLGGGTQEMILLLGRLSSQWGRLGCLCCRAGIGFLSAGASIGWVLGS